MRYPDGGGLSAEGRAKREAVRLRAAELFEQGVSSPEVAGRLRATLQAVNNWRRGWGGGRGVVPARRWAVGPAGMAVGSGSGGAWLGRRPAVDPVAGGAVDRLA